MAKDAASPVLTEQRWLGYSSIGSGTADLAIYQLADPQGSEVAVVADVPAVRPRLVDEVEYDPYGRARRTAQGDFNHTGSISPQDNLDFLNAYFAAAPAGDANDDGSTTVQDIYDFLAEYLGGDTTPTDRISGWSAWGIIDNPYGYCGYRFDAETAAAKVLGPGGGALYSVRFRVYDPIAGRWLTRDPAGFVDGMNLYEYCGGMSTSCFDPTGLTFVEGVKQVLHSIGKSVVNSPFNPLYVPQKIVGYVRDPSGELKRDVDALKSTITAPYDLGQDIGHAAFGTDNDGFTLTDDERETAAGRAITQIIIGWLTDGLSRGFASSRQIKAVVLTTEEAEALARTNARNPYGSKGKADHRAKIDELVEKARSEARPGETVVRERRVRGHSDLKRNPDVQIIDQNGRTRKVFEAERRPNGKYHKHRLKNYDKHGIEHETHPVGEQGKKTCPT